MKKKNKIFLVITTVGIVALSIFSIPKIIDIVEIIKDPNNPNNPFGDKLTALDPVTNINFDEEARLLTFNGVEGARLYEVRMTNTNLDFTYSYDSLVTSVVTETIPNSLTGHLFNFSIITKGDYETTDDSVPATYTYTLQHETERLYTSYTEHMYRVLTSVLNTNVRGGDIELDSIDTINYIENVFYVKGSAKNYEDRDFYFTISTPPKTSQYPNGYPADKLPIFDSVEIINIVTASISMNVSRVLSTVFREDFVDVTSGLLIGESDTFKQYEDQGYQIEKLQQTNTSFTYLGNGYRSFMVSGIYQATGKEDKITFELNHTVTMEDNETFINNNRYFDYFNETGDGVISDGTPIIYNADLMYHLEIMQQVHAGTYVF